MNITSLNNSKVKEWNKLKIKKYRDQEKKFIIEGDHLVNIALKNNLVESLICIEDKYDFNNKYIVTKEIMKKLSSQVSISNEMAICNFINKNKIEGNVIILDNIQDPGNMGTIIRSAVAFNFKTIIISNDSVDLYNEKTIRATEGMLFNLNIIIGNLNKYIDELRKNDYLILGTDVNKGTNISDFKDKKIALIIGNEGQGMHNNLKLLCDKMVNIKMNSKCESLNAGVAASILMSEVYHE
jgi:TrmH family RNA methyltransferase